MESYTAKYRMNKKQKLIQYKGGKCEKCGYSKIEYPRVFTFHHLDPNKKEFTISVSNVSLERAKKEVDKCLLLCQNCHSEVHDTPFINLRQSNLVKDVSIKEIAYCKTCNKELSSKKYNYCKIHRNELTRKYLRPSKETLESLIRILPILGIASKYKVSDNTIRKWLKAYSLPYKKDAIKKWCS